MTAPCVAVTGSRDWTDQLAVWRCLDALEAERGVFAVIEGGARGADKAAMRWGAKARYRGVGWVQFPADWRRYGKRAGHIRNGEMVEWLTLARDLGHEPFVLAFPLPQSVGTWDMVDQAKAAGIHGRVLRKP